MKLYLCVSDSSNETKSIKNEVRADETPTVKVTEKRELVIAKIVEQILESSSFITNICDKSLLSMEEKFSKIRTNIILI